MKVLKLFCCTVLTGVVFSSSCKRELSCEGCKGGNKPPIANAGKDTNVVLPQDSLMLDGSASTDPEGTKISYKWTKIAGPASSNIVKPDSSITLAKGLEPRVYYFELTVTDIGGLSAKDTIEVMVADNSPINEPPIANAGPDKEIILPVNSVALDGSSSTDPENTVISYNWSKIEGFPANITSPTGKQTQVTGLKAGFYLFQLMITDGGGLSDKDTIKVEVIACDNSNRARVKVKIMQVGTFSHINYVNAGASAGNKIVFCIGKPVYRPPTCKSGYL